MILLPTSILILSILLLVKLMHTRFVKKNTGKVAFRTMIIALLLIPVSAYCIMLIDTNPLMDEVKNVFLGNVSREETRGEPIDRYNIRRRDDAVILSAEVSITRLFTIHNFREGYIWVRYAHKSESAQGSLMGSGIILTKWKIKKENGKWSIVEIFEKP